MAKPKPRKTRNVVAVAAWQRSGAGKHDTRPRGQRDRKGARAAAIRDQSN